MRNRFDEQLTHLNNELITMGALCEEAISGCVNYLMENDTVMRDAALEADKHIDQKERDIERLCMRLLRHQQPVATDLRIISSALKMISDMERIGDQTSDIAEIGQYVKDSRIEKKTHISDIAKATAKMVSDSVESFVKKDINLAKKVIESDDEVDALFDKIKNELIGAVQQSDDNAEVLLDLLMIAKYFERIGDHAENIAKGVIYSITGHHANFSKNDC